MPNPLLAFRDLPDFESLSPEQAVPAVTRLLAEAATGITSGGCRASVSKGPAGRSKAIATRVSPTASTPPRCTPRATRERC